MTESSSLPKELNMTQWVTFQEGQYIVERAFLTTPAGSAIPVEEAVLEVYEGPGGRRYLRGWGMIYPQGMVNLMEETETLDLLLDLGGAFKYRMSAPELSSGKVFSPAVRSLMRFYPSRPWEALERDDFEAAVEALTVIDAAG